MEKRWILYVSILLTRYRYVETSTCLISERTDSCVYTVFCEMYAGSVPIPTCYHEPYVTLNITNSNVEFLTKSFFGATNFDIRVRVIIAMNNAWTSISSNTFSYYTRTLRIDLSRNRISTIQNQAFQNVSPLQFLNLSSNFIESLDSHSLTTASISNIETLDLSNNLLNNIVSDAIDCPNLKELYLQHNNITNLDDNVFGSLKNLTRLHLQNNKLTALNMTLIYLKQLKDLDLSYNMITELYGFEINRLTSLERVNMSNNKIKSIESNCFNQAFNLESLDLRNNYIASPIANIMFINNAELKYLNLYNNCIPKLEENAFQHNNLVYFNLDKNFISGEITEATFTGLQKIKNLNLYKQNITIINSNAFKEMINLVNLNISANNIDIIDQSGFKNTISLAVLDLSYNKIKNLVFLNDSLTNLTEIYLNNNEIVNIPRYAFASQTILTKLDISSNKIITIEQYSLPLGSLQVLNVSGNLLTGTLKSNVLSPGRYLRYLDLSSFNITRIEDMALIDLPVLARLNLSYNAIEYIGHKNFLNLNNMFSFDLSNNRLSSLQLNGTFMKSLNALYLNNNDLKDVTGAIPNATEITYLDISYNNIAELNSTAFETLKELRVLRASYNKIGNFNNPQMKLLSKLTVLDLSSNKVAAIDLSMYKNLARVDICNNILTNINTTFSKRLDNLQVFNVFNNNISAIPPGVFKNTIFLKILNISSNNLKTLRYGSLSGLNNTEVIDLSRNNITEIDAEVFHECVKVERLIIDYNQIKYLDVEQLTKVMPKLTSLSIGGNPLDCKEIVRSIRNINKTTVRSVEVTSIQKIIHEDNVYGIKCGNAVVTTTTKSVIPDDHSKSAIETPFSSALIIWCSVLTMFFILLIAMFLFWKLHYGSTGIHSQARMQFSQSVELNGSDYQSDLLN